MTSTSPIDNIIKQQDGYLLIDGGLATQLENHGFNLNTPLWSAKLLQTSKGTSAIRAVHLQYLQAGSNCVTTASYQASIPGLLESGLTHQKASDLLNLSVTLAQEARTQFLNESTAYNSPPPLIAASIGPYGAYLADGSEYRGNYQIPPSILQDFHTQRLSILAHHPHVDLLAIETIPDLNEAKALRDLLHQNHPQKPAWISFSCRDEKHLCDGTPISTAAKLFHDIPNIIAIGINCTPPQYLLPLIRQLRNALPKNQHIIAYPNSGETYHPQTRTGTGTANPIDFAEAAKSWHQAGATILGGCCRTTPGFIKTLKETLAN